MPEGTGEIGHYHTGTDINVSNIRKELKDLIENLHG